MHRPRRNRKAGFAALAGLLATAANAASPTELRPAYSANRWQEDWSTLADPAARTQPMDRLKFLPFGEDGYLSLGLNLRDRFESADGPGYGTRGPRDSYLLQRLQVHADLRVNARWRGFVQVEDVRSFGKAQPSPTDRNPLDLRQAFFDYRAPLRDGAWTIRAGRQDLPFGQQRFLSSRDGPNLRQSFDAAWLHLEAGRWNASVFFSQPVQYASESHFDDVSNRQLRFDLLHAERALANGSISFFYARYADAEADYQEAAGREWRHSLDARWTGVADRWDWDAEAVVQGGEVAGVPVRAWALGVRGGYTYSTHRLAPRMGLQIDLASGDRRSGDGKLETFHPLFPNGSYSFTQAGHTGYVNLIQLKPSIALKPTQALQTSLAIGGLWRQTVRDAVYLQPDIPLAGTAGQPGRHTATYLQLKAEWELSRQLTAAAELVRYQAGRAVRAAGGRDSDYAGLELKFYW
ncbi:hypothetical protein ASD78_13340 [Lysobacter sp. Root667]|nr:hypothetical protein ASD78_13340 [Lysobacter sp. Root667]